MPKDLADVAIRLDESDNVAVAIRPLPAGERISLRDSVLELTQPIAAGHKFALAAIPTGEPVTKYGQTIGFASRAIDPGDHVHVHNVSCDRFDRDPAIASEIPARPSPTGTAAFQGYLRPDGSVGTRNYIALVSTVNCSATTCRAIAQHFADVSKDFPQVDGVFAITHKSGCGMAGQGIDRRNLERTLAGFSRHANVFGYVVIGLGCETNQPSDLLELELLRARRPARTISIQAAGGIAKTIEAGIRAVGEMLPHANAARRSTQPASKIILGTNCGGSDGYSGITANPALGIASDLLIAHGGTSILAETTEIYGAEQLLTRRAVSKEVGERLLERIRWWEWYTSVFGAEINNNPSFGNKEGGLTTIYEKSLGAVAKGGRSALVDVVEYAEPVRGPGLVVMDTPGLDPTSVTGIVAGGANVVVFTTGRGSVYGCKPVPSIKVATNSAIFRHMESDMDANAGVILEHTSVEQFGRQLFDQILRVASGEKTKSEQQGVGEEEFSPWIVGPIL